MTRLCIICEGKTESEFARDCMYEYLRAKNVFVDPKPINKTVNIDRVVKHIRNLYPSYDYIATLVDYYGFSDRQGRSRIQLETDILVRSKNAISGFDSKRVIPYIQMHEFEALLFSDIEKFQLLHERWNNKTREKLLAIRSEFHTPEDINDDPNTAPSKRLANVFPGYSKAEYGPLIAKDIGLTRIREECPLFNGWLARLENLGQS